MVSVDKSTSIIWFYLRKRLRLHNLLHRMRKKKKKTQTMLTREVERTGKI